MRESKNNNKRVLGLFMVLFSIVTMAQFLAAIVSHSNALLVDCASMLADVISYAGNLWSESVSGKKSEAAAARSAMIASGLSLLVLYSITAWALIDAAIILSSRRIKDDLEAGVVLIFGVLGLVVDVISLLAFSQRGENEKSSASELNMQSAIGHVIADSFRSITAIVLSTMVMSDPSLNGSRCDAYATLIVALSIIVGSMPILKQWSYHFIALFRNNKLLVILDNQNRLNEHHSGHNSTTSLQSYTVSSPMPNLSLSNTDQQDVGIQLQHTDLEQQRDSPAVFDSSRNSYFSTSSPERIHQLELQEEGKEAPLLVNAPPPTPPTLVDGDDDDEMNAYSDDVDPSRR